MKRPLFLLLAVVISGAALSGCQSTAKRPQFSDIQWDPFGVSPHPPHPTVELRVIGFRGDLTSVALAAGIRKSFGVSSNVYTDEEMWRDAQTLADKVVAGVKPVIRVDPAAAEDFASRLEQAGLILKRQ